MGELGLVPVLHAMTESPDEALWKWRVARAPDLPMRCSARSAPSRNEGAATSPTPAPTCIRHQPGIRFDSEAFALRFGADRVVFGTDLYSPPLGRRISHLVPQITESGLSDAAKTAIFGGNARRLFDVQG
jgi:hypothetical protein